MLNISSKLKEEFNQQNVSLFTHKLHFTDLDSEESILVQDNIKDLKESVGIDGMPIGKFPIGILTFKLSGDYTGIFKVNGNYEVKVSDTYTFSDSTTETIMSKSFIVTSINFDKRNNQTSFECYDYANKLVKKFEGLANIAYPCTFEEYVQEFYLSNGLAVDLTNLFNAEVELLEEPRFKESISCLDVAREIGKFAMSVQYIDSSNTVKFKRASEMNTINTTSEEFINLKSFYVESDYFKANGINTLVLGLTSDIDSENVSRSNSFNVFIEGTIELRLDDLAFAWNENLKLAVIEDMFDEIQTFRYKAFELEGKQFYYEIGDVVSQVGLGDNGASFNVLILDKELIRNGSMITKYKANVQSTKETEYKWEEFAPEKRTEILIDKLKQEIQLAVETQTIQSNELGESLLTLTNTLTQTSESLQLEISRLEESDGKIVTDMQASLNMAIDNLTIAFNEMNDKVGANTETVNRVGNYFSFTPEGMIIGEDKSPMKIHIDNEEIGFLQDGQKVAYINGSTLYINKSTILDSITMANHIIEKTKSPFTLGRTLIRSV